MRDNTYISKGNREYGVVKIPKAEWKPICPPRFVYHLTRGGELGTISESFYFQRISIYLYGLSGIDKGRGGVWANSDLNSLTWAYPFVFDGLERSQSELFKLIEEYDVWRIDTRVINNKWYIDPNMQDVDGWCDCRQYLYTEISVPPTALKLFSIKIDYFQTYLYKNEPVKYRLVPEVVR
ncbi:MAG: hypothetical protein ACK4ZG_03625 [Bacteroidota bacterium]|jgi:hypothetical protein